MDRLVEILVVNAQRASVGREPLVDMTTVEKVGRGAASALVTFSTKVPQK